MRRRVYFNGKFYSGRLNGVHRVADRLIRAVDTALLAQPELQERYDFRLLAPAGCSWAPELSAIQVDEQPGGRTQFWEQVVAPWRARDGLLVNLCNLSPILHGRKITLIHDAQFFLFPGSYPLYFRLGYRFLTPLMARTSRQVLTISDFSQAMLDRFGVSPRPRTLVIKNGVDHILEPAPDHAAVDGWGLGRQDFVLLFGSAMAYKNVEVVFAAFETAALHGLKLVVVGPGRADLERVGLKPPASCVFVGPVQDAVLRALYERALCLAYPSRTEGFGLPPLEAMLCGCPAVVSPVGAIPEVCGECVMYADPESAEAWAQCFARLRDDPELRAQAIACGLRQAADFTWRRAGAQLLETIIGHSGDL